MRKYLNEPLFDQIPVLQNLLRALEEMAIVTTSNTTENRMFIVQPVSAPTDLGAPVPR